MPQRFVFMARTPSVSTLPRPLLRSFSNEKMQRTLQDCPQMTWNKPSFKAHYRERRVPKLSKSQLTVHQRHLPICQRNDAISACPLARSEQTKRAPAPRQEWEKSFRSNANI